MSVSAISVPFPRKFGPLAISSSYSQVISEYNVCKTIKQKHEEDFTHVSHARAHTHVHSHARTHTHTDLHMHVQRERGERERLL